MNTYNIKVKNEQKWLKAEAIILMPHEFKTFRMGYEELKEKFDNGQLADKFLINIGIGMRIKKLNEKEVFELKSQLEDLGAATALSEKLWAEMELISENLKQSTMSSTPMYLVLRYPSLNSCTKLNDAYNCELPDPIVLLKKVETFFENAVQIKNLLWEYAPLYDNVKGTATPGMWDSISASEKVSSYLKREDYSKELKKVRKTIAQFEKGDFELQYKTTENELLKKTSWSIFCQFDKNEKSGFLNKEGQPGSISTARLFDSDQGAIKTAKAMSLSIDNYDIVEVEVGFKKRMNLTPNFQNTQLDELAAILEKQKLDTLFKELGMEKIEAHLNELKSKIEPAESANTPPQPKRKNKI